MEVDDPKPEDNIPALKEVAKNVMEMAQSRVSEENLSENGVTVKQNGASALDSNGGSRLNGTNISEKAEESEEEMAVEEDHNGAAASLSEQAAAAAEPGAESDKDDMEVQTINDQSPVEAPSTAEDISPRRSGRKKTPTKYQELLMKEMEESSEEEIEEVEEIKDDDSDIQEIEAEDPLDSNGGVTITPKDSSKKPNVVTIDDLKTLQKLATSAKQSVDKAKSDNLMVIDTQSIIAGKMGTGVSITPAKPKAGAGGSGTGLNISPAGVTLGSGVTIRPNKPAASQGGGVSISAVDKAGAGGKQESMTDPNLTDDTFVVEAPSFIVPYVYEKPPRETIRDFNESIENEIEKKRKAKEKKKAAGEEVSDDEAEKVDNKTEEEKEEEAKKKEEKEKREKAEKEETKDAYFSSTLGKFFKDLGMNLVQEFVQADLLKQQQRRGVKDKSVAVMHAIKSLQNNLDDSKEQNEGFHFDIRKCKFCSFRTESRLVMQHHMETPHMRNFIYRCNFCEFETKIPQEVLFHMDSEHGVKGKLERAPYYHQCPQCPFEDNGKGKLTRHKVGCDKRFKNEENQKPERDWDPPAKIRPPPVRPGYTGFMQPAGRGGGVPGQIRPGSSLMPRGHQFQNSRFPSTAGRGMTQQQMKMRGMTPQMMASQQMLAVLNQQGLSVSGVKGMNNSMMLGSGGPGKSGSVTIQSLGQKGGGKAGSPSISITPLPGRNNPGSGKKGGGPGASTPNIKPGQPGQGQGGGKGNFVICEICDGYIKDLEQLRNHMQWIHKVKIHPKMIYNRPPLNCQKCQFRFFTDQGLERHLLGSHGLVTASMQDAANKGQDAGRCPVCGKVYQWKLLNHVAKDHGKTLKPAHLSYKCTVCTATFGQYKLFENHVYTAHSGVAKKGDKNKQAAKAGGSVLKTPVKLSDEISIIPTKKGDKEKKNEVIDIDDEEEIDDVEKEVIDIDNTPKKKDESAKRSSSDIDQPDAKRSKTEDD